MNDAKLRLSENALKVLEKRYLAKDEEGRLVETPEGMFHRVAHHVASAENLFPAKQNVQEWEERFYSIMSQLDFLPNSPTLMNAGRRLGQLAACFVLPIEDSMESIFEALKQTAIIHQSGGGTGFSFSRLRPACDIVRSTSGVSSGPVSFMTVFDAATEAIKQGGTRRGANMGVLRVDHPDILEFITCKRDNTRVTNFNISVGLTEAFVKAVEEGADYDLINPRTQKVVKKLNARKVFDLIVDLAWHNGDPGIVFLDRINRDNPTPQVGMIESTNPCGEQPLLPYEACTLGSINLAHCLTADRKIDYDKIRYLVHTAVRFLDNVLEVNQYPIPQIEKISKANRKIGVGVMGFADFLIELGVSYDSKEALQVANDLMRFVNEESKRASEKLAEERGMFPNFPGSLYDQRGARPLRNACTTTIAPTGSLSLIANCSSSIEPLFAICYVRHILAGEKLAEVHPLFLKIAQKEKWFTKELIRKIAETGSIRHFFEIPEPIRHLFATTYDIPPERHVEMQAAFQKYTDNAVSKTVNLPYEATREDVKRVYQLAFQLGCKGVTIYRDRSRQEQVLRPGIGKGGVEELAYDESFP